MGYRLHETVWFSTWRYGSVFLFSSSLSFFLTFFYKTESSLGADLIPFERELDDLELLVCAIADFKMSDAQREHASPVEHMVPNLRAFL